MKYIIVFLTSLILLSACDGGSKAAAKKYNKAYIATQRLCPEMLFRCLPESQKKQTTQPKTNIATTNNDEKPSEESKTMKNDVYQLSEKEEHQIKQRRQQRIYKDITQMLDLYFPKFWGDKPEKERLQWVYEVHLKLKDYEREDPKFNPEERGSLELMTTICAIIGIDFDQKPGHEPIVAFLKDSKYPDIVRLSETVEYLLFVYLERDFTLGGTYITKWGLRAALGNLPRPARPVPNLKDSPNGKLDHEEHNIKQIYFDTIRDKGQ